MQHSQEEAAEEAAEESGDPAPVRHHKWQLGLVERLSAIARLVDTLHPLITDFCADAAAMETPASEEDIVLFLVRLPALSKPPKQTSLVLWATP